MGTELTSGSPVQLQLWQQASDFRQPPEGEVGTKQGRSADLHLVTLDDKGRIPLRRSATSLGWASGDVLEVSVDGGVVRLATPSPGRVAMTLPLDGRVRLQLPYGIRSTTALRPGTRLAVLVLPANGVAAAAPLDDLIVRLLGDV